MDRLEDPRNDIIEDASFPQSESRNATDFLLSQRGVLTEHLKDCVTSVLVLSGEIQSLQEDHRTLETDLFRISDEIEAKLLQDEIVPAAVPQLRDVPERHR
jgi:hypothetical protein